MVLKVVVDSDDPEIIELCERYWDFQEERFVETVEQIESDNSLSKTIHYVISKYCFAFSTEFDCTVCNTPFRYKNRTEFIRLYGKVDHVDWVCAECEKNKSRVKEEAQRNKLIADFENAKEYPLIVEELGVREAVLLRTLILYSATEDMSYIDTFDRGQVVPFSPLYDYSIKLVREMYHSSIINIHPYTNLSLLDFSEDLSFRFSLTQIPWVLSLNKDISMEEFSSQLSKKISSLDYIDSDAEELRNLCYEISLNECIAYLETIIDEYDFNFRVGPKTIEALNKALNHFSVAQVYNFIWRAGKDAAAYYQRSMVSKSQAANSIVGSIDRSVDQALANKWEVKPYRRRYDEPQSVLSKVVFNHLLHTDDGGFNSLLSKLL